MKLHDLSTEDLARIVWTLGRDARSSRKDAKALETEYPETAKRCREEAEKSEELAARLRKALTC